MCLLHTLSNPKLETSTVSGYTLKMPLSLFISEDKEVNKIKMMEYLDMRASPHTYLCVAEKTFARTLFSVNKKGHTKKLVTIATTNVSEEYSPSIFKGDE